MDVSLGSVFGGGPLEAKITKLNLGGLGIRDLAVSDSSFLILAGPASEDGGAYAVYMWDGSNPAKLSGELPPFTDDGKPEAILPLDGNGHSTRLLVLSDGLKECGPRETTLGR